MVLQKAQDAVQGCNVVTQPVKALHHDGVDTALLHGGEHGKQGGPPKFGAVLLLHARIYDDVATPIGFAHDIGQLILQRGQVWCGAAGERPYFVLDKIDYENMLLLVQSMDEKYKTPLLLKVQGYKVSEIADFLNISPGNVKVRLHRARKIILTGLEENGNE